MLYISLYLLDSSQDQGTHNCPRLWPLGQLWNCTPCQLIKLPEAVVLVVLRGKDSSKYQVCSLLDAKHRGRSNSRQRKVATLGKHHLKGQ